jgi:hypothetical protein
MCRYGVVKERNLAAQWVMKLVNLSSYSGGGVVLFEDTTWIDARLSYEWALNRARSGYEVVPSDFL